MKEKKKEVISVRLGESEREELEMMADAEGRSVSSFIRMAISEYVYKIRCED